MLGKYCSKLLIFSNCKNTSYSYYLAQFYRVIYTLVNTSYLHEHKCFVLASVVLSFKNCLKSVIG